MRPLAAIALLSALSGCASSAPADLGPPPAIRGAELVVREARAAQPLYIEGSFGYLRIVRLDRGIVVRKGRARTADPGHTRTLLRRFLPPARYRITAYQRPCDGNCGYLDGPTERCDVTVAVRDGRPRSVTLEVTPGAGCTARVR
jgi:hypothetical protein